MTFSLVTFPGDGVGPEVMAETVGVLNAVAPDRFTVEERLLGGCAIDAYGVPLRDEDIAAAQAADAILLGAVGGPKWDDPNAPVRPEQGLLKIRKALGLFANLRPVRVNDAVIDSSPLKADRIRGTDFLVVRELTGGLYFGRPQKRWKTRRGLAAVDTMLYREHEVRRIVELAFKLADGRKRQVTSVDKANVLETSRMWRAIVTEVATHHPDIACEHMLVDAMAMNLIRKPAAYDVIVTENMFGDILTDEASMLGGSLGNLPSASLGSPKPDGRRPGLYEPIHGSAPDIAGTGVANPVGMILSAAMMLRLSFEMHEEASRVESAVDAAIGENVRTADLGGSASTQEMGEAIRARL